MDYGGWSRPRKDDVSSGHCVAKNVFSEFWSFHRHFTPLLFIIIEIIIIINAIIIIIIIIINTTNNNIIINTNNTNTEKKKIYSLSF